MSLFGLVDGDEGTYLLVSRLVIEGQLPYHDFYYPQMFLLPYVYGAWMTLVGYSWYGARLLSAFFSVALGLLLYRQAARRAGARADRKSTRLNSSHTVISYAVFCLKKKLKNPRHDDMTKVAS